MKKSYFQRIISTFLSLLLLLEPFAANKLVYQALATAVPWGMAALGLKMALNSTDALAQYDGVPEGKNAGGYQLTNILNNLPTVNAGRDTLTLPSAGGVTQNQPSLVPTNGAQTGDDTSVKSSFGNQTTYDGVVVGVVGRVAVEPSTQGDVYRSMMDSKRRRADYKNASFLNTSKTKMNEGFTGCTTTNTVTPNAGQTIGLSEDKTCSRIVETVSECKVDRLYDIVPPAVSGDVVSISNDLMETNFGLIERNAGWYDDVKTVSVNWANVSSVLVSNLLCDDDCAIWVKNSAGGAWTLIPSTSTTGTAFATCGERGGNISVAPPAINITSYIQGWANLQIKINVCVMDKGRETGKITWNTTGTGYIDRGFIQTPAGCWREQFDNVFCHADSWSCLDDSSKMAGSFPIDITVVKDGGGKAIWSDNTPYENTAFEATNVCWKAEASGLCNFIEDDFPCFTSMNGTTVCPTNDGEHSDSCDPLIDAGCTFVEEKCMESTRDPVTNSCMVYTSSYKCLTEEVDISTGVTTSSTTTCAATRCMGTECTTPGNESNSSFGLLSGLLGNINSMAQDGECDASGCVLFKGKNLQCQKAMGGLFDCCDKSIPGVNWMDYFKLAHGSYKLAQEYELVSELPSVSGLAKNAANGLVQSVGDLIGSEFMSAFDIGSAGASLVPASISAFSQGLVTQAYAWVSNSFGPIVAQNFFSVTATGSGTTISLGAAQGSMMATAMTVFMWVYLAYLILSIIFACKDTDFELAASKQMKTCHYVGTYCAGKALGWCYAKKESYCCYSSALSRIMQQQVRKQIMGWGSAKSPSCGGLTPADMQLVDWDLVNLDEYTAMLAITGIKPEAGEEEQFYKMENLTKINMGGDAYTTDRGDTSIGLNAVEALEKQTESSATTGVLADGLRMDATNAATSGFPVSP